MENTNTKTLPIPDYRIMAYARLILPEIQKYFDSEEGQREFASWQAQQSEQEGAAE